MSYRFMLIGFAALLFVAPTALSQQHSQTENPSSAVASPDISVSNKGGKPLKAHPHTLSLSPRAAVTPPINVNSTFSITMSYDWFDDNDTCTVNSGLDNSEVTVTMIDPAGHQADVGTLSLREVLGSPNCKGHFNKAKPIAPLTAKGQYVFVVQNAVFTLHPLGRTERGFSRLQIVSDGQTVFDQNFTAVDNSYANLVAIFVVEFK